MSVCLYCLKSDPLINHWKSVCDNVYLKHNVKVITKPVSDFNVALHGIKAGCVLHFEGTKCEDQFPEAADNFAVEAVVQELVNPINLDEHRDEPTLVRNPDQAEDLQLASDYAHGASNSAGNTSRIEHLSSDISDTSLFSVTSVNIVQDASKYKSDTGNTPRSERLPSDISDTSLSSVTSDSAGIHGSTPTSPR